MSDTIKENLSKIKELNKDVYDILIHDKLEFDRLTRFKKGIKQLLRKYKAGGLRAVFNNLSSKKVINKINSRPVLSGVELSDKKKILYITITPSFNLLRQSIYIRKNGNYETILLMENPWLLKLMEKHFDTVYIYDTYYELANILKEIKPYIIHVQGAMLGSDFLCIFAKLLGETKFVFEFYDIPSLCASKEDSINAWGGKNTELGFFSEQYACENADGIILGYSKEAADILKKRYHIKAPMLEFHSYVCNEFVANGNNIKYSQEDEKIHLVYGGTVTTSILPKKIFGYEFLDLVKEITKQGICFDIYTTPHTSPIKFEMLFSDYITFSKENKFFRFMEGLFLDEAARAFSRYDFGIIAYIFNQEIFSDVSNKTRLPAKFFLFLEAGLPIILSEEFEYGSKLVREYEIGIVVSQNDMYNLSKIIPTYDYEKLRKNVMAARKELSMEAHIDRLLDFYEDIKKS